MPLRPLPAILSLALCAPGAGAADFSSLPMGRCVGASAPAAPPALGTPIDFRMVPQGEETLKSFLTIDFSTDERTGYASDAQGRPVTQAYLDWLQAPADFSEIRAPSSSWTMLQMTGYRLDETTCRLAMPGAPPISRLAFALMRANVEKSSGQLEAVEVLKAQLQGLPASETLPEGIRLRMEQLEKAGSALPPGLRRLLDDPGLTVGSLSQDAQAAYLEQTRFFDGQARVERLSAAAGPASWVRGSPSSRPMPLLPDEQKLGNLLIGDAVKRFDETPSGRELMSRFTGKDGKVLLPSILILKANQRPDERGEYGAYYDLSHDLLVLNHWQAEASLLARLPDSERARLGDSLSDPAAVSHYLESHPKERAALLGDIDEIFFHELVHAWQDRRSRLDVEILRGNTPPYTPIDKEHEAFREQCRYDFDKAKADPDSLMRSGYAPPLCFPILKSYDSFADGITRIYLGGFAGALPLKTIGQIQQERESAARTLAENMYEAAVEKLKLAGMWHGSEALAEAESDFADREKKFRHTALPALIAQAVGPLPVSYETEGRRDWAAILLQSVDPSAPGRGEALRRLIAASKPSWAKPPKGDALPQLGELSFAVTQARAGVVPADAAVEALYLRDARLYVAQCLSAAAGGDKTKADAAVAQARIWVAALPAGDPLRASVERLSTEGAP